MAEEIETDAQMREIISKYIITGNLEVFVDKVNIRHKELRELGRWRKK
jgi:hypothetical protein